MEPQKLITKWRQGTLDAHQPLRVVATIEARCNLACQHCYWAHDLNFQSAKDWAAAVARVKELGVPLVYAGRILGQAGAAFLRECVRQGVEFSIVDNGYTVLTQPDLLPLYRGIEISIDGWREAHDAQRNRVGAFDKAWSTVLELKRWGLDPVVDAAFSPLSFEGWEKFEALLAEHDVPLSCTLVWALPETAKRGTAVFREDETVRCAFEKLLGGIPKLINLYAPEHIRPLRDILRRFEWREDESDGDCLVAKLTNGTEIAYRPPSVAALSELVLHWDGKFYTPPTYGAKMPLEQVGPEYVESMRKIAAAELADWNAVES